MKHTLKWQSFEAAASFSKESISSTVGAYTGLFSSVFGRTFRFANLQKKIPNLFWGWVTNYKGTAVKLAGMWQKLFLRALFHSLVVMWYLKLVTDTCAGSSAWCKLYHRRSYGRSTCTGSWAVPSSAWWRWRAFTQDPGPLSLYYSVLFSSVLFKIKFA